jgi:hypothetical protein
MIGREVITLILSAAVAAVVVALAVRMLPGAGQLAYGSPMPVFKVAYSNGAVQLWVEDFAGVPYQRAYFYVDGRYVGSEPPGGKITVRCGDRVAALVQYASGVKEVNGTVMCARPARAPGGTPQLFDVYSATMLEAYRAATGDVERTGLPLKITGGIDCNGNGQVTFTTAIPNALICAGWTCGQSLTFGPGTVNMYVYKIPDTVLASQYLGGAHAVFVISVRAFQAGYWSYYLYVNGTLVAYCKQQVESRSGILTQYQIANASGVYLLDLWRPGSDKMFMGNFAIWKKPDGSFGFQIFVNPTDQAPPSDCPYRIPTNFGPVCANLYSSASSKSLFDQFISWVQSNPSAINALSDSLKYIEDASYNVPQIAKNYTYTIDTVHAVSRSYTIDLSLGTLMPASLGAVFANAVLPSDIQAPPVGTPNGTSVPPVSFIASYGG